jgi:hypothetical protein
MPGIAEWGYESERGSAIQVMLIIATSVPSNVIFGGWCAGHDRQQALLRFGAIAGCYFTDVR